ncbi:uncharacterized protein LOC112453358 [Temnothorax curvispinosus]|uniref:Uncharacterized protein LOC112453358 n=1 Tax=Temnothorax curvispinosus TaxID=300111 RepID=A0A6J1PJN7_9HYME|nr:uncharacterized protein LOC112453358 [Temnothorax curvispinosus]
MSEDLQGLLIEQNCVITSIRRVLINFKKLSKSQITLSKTKSQLQALETLWEKCHAINVSIHQTATAEERKTAPYFLEEQFYAAEDAYLEASDYLNDTVSKLSKSEPSTAEKASQTRPTELWPHLHDLKLADPEPSSRHPIHVLIGADLYGSLLLNDVRQGPFGTPTAQLTVLGWIVSGPTGNASSDTESASVLNCVTCEETNSLLQQFWADKSIPAQTFLTEEDERCERHFVETHSRNSQGRYIVRLPFKNGPPGNIGDTLQRAMLLYKKMKSRLLQRPTIANQYHKFLAEYESMGHMKLASACEASLFSPVYIPHHFVLRGSSSTTKLRVVFNASCKTSDGTSLNDHLMVGPNLQQGLDEGKAFPAALQILEEQTYVDDVLFGEDDIATLKETRAQLIALMKRGGFPLHKWSAKLLQDIPVDQCESSDRNLKEDDTLKVLGLSWSPHEDSFRFLATQCSPTVHTKRSILSFIAKLYDPLEWASPIVISAKILMQELWLQKLEWDTPIPEDLLTRWTDYSTDLCKINDVRIPRWTGMHRNMIGVELHGFADASSRAYAAVVYLRVPHSNSNIQISLLAAKTKVAPLKTVSVPRLELNAVVLLIRLLEWVRTSLKFEGVLLFGWTDSNIVLAWIRQHLSRWNSYVANRVSEIQTRLPSMNWNHVRSKDNPADCASRGLSATELVRHELWWSGPPWLRKHSDSWPIPDEPLPMRENTLKTVLAEERKSAIHHADSSPEWDLPDTCSS